MRLLLIGPPGSGKGTQATRIGNHYGIAHISSGELLRRQVELDTAIGRAVRDQLSSGDLVSDGIVMDLLRRPVETANRQGGYVLDGFPRTVAQAEAAYEHAVAADRTLHAVVCLDISHDLLLERIEDRGRSSGRSDDTPSTVLHRIEEYEQKTLPLLDYYAQREKLVQVNGARPVSEVSWSIAVQLQRFRSL